MSSRLSGPNIDDKEYKLLEEEVFELEEYIKGIWEFIPIAMAYVNPKGMILDADNAFAKLMKMPREDIVGTHLQDHFSNKKDIEKLNKETIAQGQIKTKEAVLLDKNHQEIPINISSQARKDSEGTMVGYFISFIDLTERKKAETILREKITELEEFHDLATGREIKMIELEKEVDDLLRALGREPKYNQRK